MNLITLDHKSNWESKAVFEANKVSNSHRFGRIKGLQGFISYNYFVFKGRSSSVAPESHTRSGMTQMATN